MTITYIDFYQAIHDQRRANLRIKEFAMRDETSMTVRKINDREGRPIWEYPIHPTGRPGTIYCFPVVIDRHIPEGEVHLRTETGLFTVISLN